MIVKTSCQKWGIMLVRICVFLIFFTSLWASKDATQLYLAGKDKEALKALEKNLLSREYWLGVMKDGNFSLGFYQDPKNILVACKKCSSLKHYYVNDKSVIELSDLNATFGKEAGDKRVEGDLKTPIGVYGFRQKIHRPTLSSYYGPVAFVTNYPNHFDAVLKKNGYGIWLHGYPLDGEREDLQTKGCVAIENDDLSHIESLIDHKKTLLIINENKTLHTNKEELATILAFIFQWRDAWMRSDLSGYKKFYSLDFEKPSGVSYEQFMKKKQSVFAQNTFVELHIDDLQVTPYPNSLKKKMFKISFTESYRSNIHRFSGTKELFVQVNDGKFLILVEN